jgi:phosphoglycolate phosphatase
MDIGDLERFKKRRKLARQSFAINPARAYSCVDEYSDYFAAIGAGTHPFVVAYGFEDSVRLSQKFGVPPEIISTSPEDFTGRLLHALYLPNVEMAPRLLILQESS